MKEATAINVQGSFAHFFRELSLNWNEAHVEHFKAELGREVAAITRDVEKLHREKQALGQQIADLFAFYSKQRQEGEVCVMFDLCSPLMVSSEHASRANEVDRISKFAEFTSYKIGTTSPTTKSDPHIKVVGRVESRVVQLCDYLIQRYGSCIMGVEWKEMTLHLATPYVPVLCRALCPCVSLQCLMLSILQIE